MLRKLERAKAIRRLYQRMLERVPGDMPESKRKAAAERMLDDELGPTWRQVASVPGFEVVTVSVTPAPPGSQSSSPDAFFQRVRKLLSDTGEHPDAVTPPTPEERAEDGEAPEPECCPVLQRIRKIRQELDCLEAELDA